VNNLGYLQVFAGALPTFIFFNNLRVLVLQSLLGVFTFGVVGIFIFMLPWGIVGFATAQFALAGENPLAFLLATIVPHALVELPAILLASAAALRWHVTIISPPPDRTLSEGFLWAVADYARLFFGVVIPLLLVAALVESYITPQVMLRVFGG
jgi:stage II sporulation protein M